MAEVLFILTDSTNTSAWMAGDPVIRKPDGHQWGTKEVPPRFFVVEMTDSDADAIQFGPRRDEGGNIQARAVQRVNMGLLNAAMRASAALGRVNARSGAARALLQAAWVSTEPPGGPRVDAPGRG